MKRARVEEEKNRDLNKRESKGGREWTLEGRDKSRPFGLGKDFNHVLVVGDKGGVKLEGGGG